MKSVSVQDEVRLIMSYASPDAEELPMFAENRVHQRSSGNPYPCKVVMQVDRKHRTERPFRVITLENEFLKIELMPELGGRIYSALDKRTGYDFFYKQHVIKPALIGLLGSWISGGCEFNWPCHHRPGTYMPVDVQIERHPDGAVTVWMSENEPLDRMKGMVGVHLAPNEARFDTRMKVYNGTPSRHSFLWWENAAVPVNEQYRLVFPPDVHYVQFHYRKNVTSYPVASGVYNGIRMGNGVNISYHKNTHQPTSYFCAPTKYDFFGGYDEGKHCGVVHVADHTVSVGKKMFTWAYNQLSQSWERALTDTDGAYAELMASSYSLNQPDFAWLMPYEGKDFSQMWYPVGSIGVPLCACREAAVSFENGCLHLQTTIELHDASLIINNEEHPLNAKPEQIFSFPVCGELNAFKILSRHGKVLLDYEKCACQTPVEMPATIPDNPTLNALKSAQEAYLLGVHAEQYRDPAVRPAAYWQEALKRDPDFAPALIALANDELHHFRPEKAYELATHAWRVLTIRNFHPESGELQYLMGRISEALGRDDEAWEAYMQAAWAQDARSRALTRAAMIDGRKQHNDEMLAHADEALKQHAGNETAMLLKVVALRRLKSAKADVALAEAEKHDPLNLTLRALKYGAADALYQSITCDKAQAALDIAPELADMGETALASSVLANLPKKTAQTEYVRRYLDCGCETHKPAQPLGTGIAYPSRVIEYKALKKAVSVDKKDAEAMNLLACLLYASGNYAQAAELWQQGIEAKPTEYMSYRNLAVARYSHLNDKKSALSLMQKALRLKPNDGELIWETAHLMVRLHEDPLSIVSFLRANPNEREDIAIELCRALNMAGEYQQALNVLNQKRFTPCEGGEHAVAEQYMFAHHALGRMLLKNGQTEEALSHFRAAQTLPDNLGAGLWNEVLLVPHQFYEAICLKKLGASDDAKCLFEHILLLKIDYFSNMHLPELCCWQAMALKQTGRPSPAQELLAEHLRRQRCAAVARDAGYYKTTPFFISFMEDSAVLRAASCEWQQAMISFAADDMKGAKVHARNSLRVEPANLYAHLLTDDL